MSWGKYIVNYDSNIVINATADDDEIENVYNVNYGEAKNVLINAGKGNDTVKNEDANFVTINGGKGNDYIDNSGGLKVSINGGAGDDYISNGYYNIKSDNATLDGGAGNDYILNESSKVLIYGGTGHDGISNYGDNVTIFCGNGKDTVDNYGDNVTIYGGAGNDSVEESDYNVNTVYVYGGGKDTLTYFRGLGTIVLGSVKVNSSVRSGNGTIKLNLSNDKTLTLKNYLGEEVNIVSTISDVKKFNVIRNTEENVFVKGTTKNDFISNGSNYVTIGGGKGNDYILNETYRVSVDGGAGNDTIISKSEYNTIFGGAGNDTIYNDAGNETTIFGGKGDDTIYSHGGGVLFGYDSGDGNDIIQGFNDSSTLSIVGGEYSTQKSGKDLIVTVGKGKITLVGAASLTKPNIVGDFLSVTNSAKSSVTVGSKIKTVDASTRTKAVKIVGNKLNNSIVGGAGNDTLSGGKGNDKLVGGAGNDSLNGDAGNDTLSGGSGSDTLIGGSGNDSLSGYTGNDSLWGGAGNDTLIGGKGDDIFVYKPNEGTDTITDFQSGDMLKILNADGTNGTFTKAAFASNKLTLTIDGGGSVIFTNVGKGDKININGTSYTISGKTLK